MNKSVNPLVAVAVILAAAVVLGLKFWFDHQALRVARPSLMQPHPRGGVVVLVGTSLFHVAPDLRLVDRTDLGAFGITEAVGDFAYFANGDLLIRTGSAESSLIDDLRIFARAENTNYQAAPEGSELNRCSVEKGTCSRFSSQLPVLDRTFRLHIDWLDDRVYLADTSRHRLMMFTASGELLASEGGLKFPNQLRRYDDRLWLADTNHHGIRELSIAKGRLVMPGELHRTVEQNDWRWPSAFVRVGDRWWVNTMLSGMRHGKVLIYDKNWNREKLADLPEGADPIGMELLGREVVISDLSNIAIYRFTQDGVRLPDLDVQELTRVLVASREQARRYQGLGYLTLAVGILALGAIFAVAVIQQKKNALVTQQVEKGDVEAERLPSNAGVPREGLVFTVSEEMRRLSRLSWVLGPAFVVMALWLFVQKGGGSVTLALAMAVPILGLLPMLLTLSRWIKVRITMYPDRVVVHDHGGQKREEQYHSLLWSNAAVIVKGQVIPIRESQGKAMFSGFGKAIRPLLHERNRVGWIAMVQHTWRSPEGWLKSAVVTFVVFATGYVFLEFAPLREWLSRQIGL